MNLLRGTWFLKIAAFVLAVMTYSYIQGEIRKAEQKPTDPSFKLLKLTAKRMPIQVRLSTSPAEGSEVLVNNISSSPKEILVVAPEQLFETASHAETAPIDISESNQTVVRKVAINKVAGIPLAGELYMVEATIPIRSKDSAQ